MHVKRMRIIAGPNGSGKTTLLKNLIHQYHVNMYTYINADDLFKDIQKHKKYPLPFSSKEDALRCFAQRSTFPDKIRQPFIADLIKIEGEFVVFSDSAINTYTVALFADFLRQQYLEHGSNFSFETVFSAPQKIDFIKEAIEAGYRVYLYIVATDDALINIDRIKARVELGGHDVPINKIKERYVRTLNNLHDLLPIVSRAYFFDNSGTEMLHFAEFDATSTELTVCKTPPDWFKRFLD